MEVYNLSFFKKMRERENSNTAGSPIKFEKEKVLSESEIKQQVAFDLATAPVSVLPAVFGGSLALLSWAVGNVWLGFCGFLGISLGVAVAATRFVLGFEKYVESAKSKIVESNLMAKKAISDNVKRKLTTLGDADAIAILNRLNDLYREFTNERIGGKITHTQSVELVEQLYQGSLRLLDQYYFLKFNGLQQRTTKNRKEFDSKSKKILDEVEDVVTRLEGLSSKFVDDITAQDKSKLQNTLQELELGLDVARRAEQRVRDLGLWNDKESA